ncbi:hypothetical protein ACFFRR_010484 [Megaselia abdita]
MRVLVALSVLIGFTLVSCETEINLTPESICTLVQEGNYVRGIDDCKIYYQCVNGKPVQYSCGEGSVFNKETSACVKSKSCDPIVDSKCSGKVDGFVADPQLCSGYYFCEGGKVLGRGQCPEGQKFDEGVVGGSCVWDASNQKCATEAGICDYIKKNEFFGIPDNCASWKKCTDGPMTSGSCNDDLKLDLTDGSCSYESDCRQVSGPSENPVTRPPPSSTAECKGNESEDVFIKDGSTCGGYYYCAKGNPLGRWGLCANNNFFNGTHCVDRSSIVCDEDRCQGMGPGTRWVNIKGDGCVGYHFCQDGKRMPLKPGKCENWFDEKSQKCVNNEVNYPACSTGTEPPIDEPTTLEPTTLEPTTLEPTTLEPTTD